MRTPYDLAFTLKHEVIRMVLHGDSVPSDAPLEDFQRRDALKSLLPLKDFKEENIHV